MQEGKKWVLNHFLKQSEVILPLPYSLLHPLPLLTIPPKNPAHLEYASILCEIGKGDEKIHLDVKQVGSVDYIIPPFFLFAISSALSEFDGT